VGKSQAGKGFAGADDANHIQKHSPIRYIEQPKKIQYQTGSEPMTATLLYRISAFVLVLFAVGHTLGFLRFKAPTPEGVAVQQAMDNVRFSVGGKTLRMAISIAASDCSAQPICCSRRSSPGTLAQWLEALRRQSAR
jgi:hypothetical protein